MYGGFVFRTAEYAGAGGFNVHTVGNQNVDPAKNRSYLNNAILFNDGIFQIAVNTAKDSGEVCAFEDFAVISQVTAGKHSTACFDGPALCLDIFNDLAGFTAEHAGKHQVQSDDNNDGGKGQLPKQSVA